MFILKPFVFGFSKTNEHMWLVFSENTEEELWMEFLFTLWCQNKCFV